MNTEISFSDLPHDMLRCILKKLPEVCADEALLHKSILAVGRSNREFREATLEVFPAYSILMAAEELKLPHLRDKDALIEDAKAMLSSKVWCRGTAAAAFLLAAGLLIGCSFLTPDVGISMPICMFGGVAAAVGLFYLFGFFCGISHYISENPEEALQVVVIKEKIKAIDSAKKSLVQKFPQDAQAIDFFRSRVERLSGAEQRLFHRAKSLNDEILQARRESNVEVFIESLAPLSEGAQESERLLSRNAQ